MQKRNISNSLTGVEDRKSLESNGLGAIEQWSVISFVIAMVIGMILFVLFINRRKKRQVTKEVRKRMKDYIEEETSNFDAFLLRHLHGGTKILDYETNIQNQLQNLPYGKSREISQSAFEIVSELGSGNFGTVFKGQLMVPCEEHSKCITVAIKTVNVAVDSNDIKDLLLEIKLMSHIKPNLNLVSMIGSCTSELKQNGKLWLIIEYCEYGDLKRYLNTYKNKLLSGTESDSLNIRCLLKWSYDVAKGMEYLAENKIMHGDLAARNVLMGSNVLGTECPIGKVADFGLSKNFYDSERYEKTNRMMVPWKWMAIEYLKEDYFTMKSDVWSFGVLLWEILSLGKNPYGQQDYDEVLQKLERGYRLPCPKEFPDTFLFSFESFYKAITEKCFVASPEERAAFYEIVQIIENFLLENEKNDYMKTNSLYQTCRAEAYLKLSTNSNQTM